MHMDLFWSADGQCLGEASDMPMTSERGGGGDDDDNGDSIIQNLDNYELILKTTVHKSVDMDVPSHILHLKQKSFETFFYL